jgi:hypothetical protein
MKRFLSLATCAFFAVAVSAFAQPKLEIIGGTTHDWGTVSIKKSPLKADIVLKNTGSEKLTLNDPKPSCGCTTAPLEKKELSPGESTTMHVTLNVSHEGPVTKSVTITSNDPKNPNVPLYLKANVFSALTVSPTYLAFNELQVGKKATSKVVIKNTSDKSITLSDFSATNGLKLRASKPIVLKAGTETEIEAEITPEKAGYFNSTVSIKTNHPDFEKLEFQSYGNVTVAPKSQVFDKR